MILALLLSQAARAETKPFPALKPALSDRIAAIEKDLAARMLKRAEAPSPELELLIDLQIIDRWLLSQAVNAKSQSELQIALIIRESDLRSALTDLEPALQALKAPLTHTQSDSMALVHKMSFELNDVKTVSELDDFCKRLGYALLNSVSATPVDARTIVPMRPKPLQPAGDGIADASPQQGYRSVAELSAEINRANLPASLRQQLAVIAKAAAVSEAAQKEDARLLQQTLSDGLDLAKGLSTSAAFPPDLRTQIETQLAEGLALSGDPRTRSIGRDRIGQLTQYRNIMARLQQSKLSPELRKTFGQGLANAQVNPEAGEQLLGLLDRYVKICRRFESIPRRENPVPNLRRATDDAAKLYESTRQSFVVTANDPMMNRDLMETELADLSAIVDLYATLDGMKETYETLNSYKPRPTGAIEARTLKAALAAVSFVKSPIRTEAMRYLSDLTKLAQLSNTATVKSMSDIPPQILKAYAGIGLPEFESKCRTMMLDLITQAASGAELDKTKVARLRAVGDLCDSLRYAVLAEKALGSMGALPRWVDWMITVEQTRALLAPYQKQLTAAFTGFVQDAPNAVETFLQQREQYLPTIAFLSRAASYADQCAALPEGLSGDFAQMMTPLDGQPFATERYISYALLIADLLSGSDTEAAGVIQSYIADRLHRDLKREVRDLTASPVGKVK